MKGPGLSVHVCHELPGLTGDDERLGFTATSISFTIAIGGLVSMPGSLLMGWLSDRIGRKRLVLACYAAGLTSLLVLAWPRSLGNFWCASVLLAILSSSSAAGSALVTDSLPAQALGRGLSFISGASNLGGFLASPVMGLALQQLGQPNAFLVSLVVPIVAIAVFLPIREGYAA